eukprot:14613021-Heterocapsa_arctica.AAC.1
MNKFTKDEVKKWLDDHPDRKAEAMMDFDKTLMNDKGMWLSAAMELLSGRLFDALIGNPMGRDRGWKPLDPMTNQCHR